MEKGENFRITKLEKGPLQRFKNQNLLLKKFGEVALQIYRVITGKRTTNELVSDLEMDPELFTKIINYMEEASMIELKPLEGGAEEKAVKKEEPKEEVLEITPSEERITPSKARAKPEKEEIAPEEEIKPEGLDFEVSEKPKEKKKTIAEETETMITPIGDETVPEEEKKEEITETIEEEKTEEKAETGEERVELERLDEISPKDETGGEELTPVEKMIKEKYGGVGIKVYELIDGQRTAEEIMKETGLTETKLVEILDFMDEQGIIKLEYPHGKKPGGEKKSIDTTEQQAILPLTGDETDQIKDISPVNVPIKTPSNIIRDVQLKAQVILKFGERGGRVWDSIDAKNDSIDLALKTDTPLYEVDTIISFFLGLKSLFIKPLSRDEVRKKYGEEGYTIYKRYGKEGLMLYELVGKEMTIKQMVEKVSKDKQKGADMFLFIHQVLRIDLPLDKDMLYKQLGI